jgi:hypothetical protein
MTDIQGEAEMARAKESGSGKPDVPLLERDGMISKEELALFLDIPEGTLDHWASRGGGPAFHGIGNHRKYLPADVREWLKSRRKEISSEKGVA